MSSSGRSPRKKVQSDASDADRTNSPYRLRETAKVPSRYRDEDLYISPSRHPKRNSTGSPKKSPSKRVNGRDSPAVSSLTRNSSLTILAKAALDDFESSSSGLDFLPREERRQPRRALALSPPQQHDPLARDLELMEMRQNQVAGLDDLDNPDNMTNEAIEHRSSETFFSMFNDDQEKNDMVKKFKSYKNQQADDVSTYMRANIKKLYNLLRYKKARQWVMCEFFYSAIDEQIFTEENEFQTILKESFPNLKTYQLTRVEWRTIRRLLGKPRRCSQTFFDEERSYLEDKRAKIRSVYEGSYLQDPTIDLKDLPAKLPRQLNVGSRVYARIRNPYDGIYAGVVDTVIPSGFRIVFDKTDIPKLSVSDTEVLFDGKKELYSIAYFIEQANSKLPSGVRPFVAAVRDSKRPHCVRDELVSRMERGGPLKGPNDERLNGGRPTEMVGNFPLNFLVNLVKLTKVIEIKKTLMKQFNEMNSEAEMTNMVTDKYSLEFREKFAKMIRDLEHVNQHLDTNLNGIQDHTMYFSADITNQKPDQVRKTCYQQAGRFVEHCNHGLNVEDVHALTLIQALTAVLLQVRALGGSKISAVDLNSLGDVINEIRNTIHPSNAAFFQDYVEVHLKQFHQIMIDTGSLSSVSSTRK